MTANKLKLNDDKTEVMIISSSRMSTALSIPDSLDIDNASVPFSIGILLVCGNRIQGYRKSKRMAVNGMVERLCKEEEVGYVDMWDSFVGNEELYFRDGLHLSGKGAAVLAEGLSGAVASGLGKVRYLN